MDVTGRGLIVAIAAVALLGGATAYGAVAFAQSRALPADDTSTPMTSVEAGTIVFRQTGGGAKHGFVASVAVDDPAGPRAVSTTPCDRVDATTAGVVCLRADLGISTTFETLFLDGRLDEVDRRPLAGIPSRTRLSPDGRLAATTSFITGHAYAGTDFSTSTVIVEVGSAPEVADSGELELFPLRVDGALVTAADLNVWGVTFVDDRRFYATAASGDHRWLVEGDLVDRTLTALRDDVECPSLSPDGTRIAFKQNRAGAGQPDWALAVLDLRDGDVVVLPEPASVDDQAEWLDDDTLLYGRSRASAPGDTDVYEIAADATSGPGLLIEHAWSPAVVRS